MSPSASAQPNPTQPFRFHPSLFPLPCDPQQPRIAKCPYPAANYQSTPTSQSPERGTVFFIFFFLCLPSYVCCSFHIAFLLSSSPPSASSSSAAAAAESVAGRAHRNLAYQAEEFSMHTLHLSEPGLHASCFLEKSVKGFCLWQALHSTKEP